MQNKTILVVDDDPTVLHLLHKKISQVDGYDVLTAQDGSVGLALAIQHKPDIILLDVMMPEKSGGEVAKMLEEDPDTKDIPIIFISVLLDSAGKKLIEVNEHEYRAVSKPIYLPELLSQIRKAINEANN